MATLASLGGNFTAAGSWALVDATSFVDRGTAITNTSLTTSYTNSSTFTPGAIVIDGIGLMLFSRASSPSGTMTVALDQGGSDVAGTEVIINVSDIPNNNNYVGWVFFKFASPVTLSAATAYSIKAKTSVASQVSLYYVSTTANRVRFLRTTTTQAPASNDTLIIVGDRTGAGTGNNITITLDNTATTTFGGISVSARGILTLATTASTNFNLKINVTMFGYSDCTIIFGSIATPLPSSSTFTFEFVPVAQVGVGLEIRYGTFTAHGAIKSTALSALTANVAAGATTIPITDSTGWVAGDEIAIASTTRVPGQCEKRTISSVPNGTSVTVSALTYAHDGTGLVVAEVVNLTRNIRIIGTSTSLQGYLYIDRCVLYINSVEFSALGSSTVNKRGVNIAANANTTILNCSIHTCTNNALGFYLTSVTGASAATFNVSNNASYNIARQHMYIDADVSVGELIIDNNYCILTVDSGFHVLYITTYSALTVTNNHLVGAANSIDTNLYINFNNTLNNSTIISDNVIHSGSGNGMHLFTNSTTYIAQGLIFERNVIYRNDGRGLMFQLNSNNSTLTFKDWVIFGNDDTMIQIVPDLYVGELIIDNLSAPADSLYNDVPGIKCQLTSRVIDKIIFQNCDFSGVNSDVFYHNSSGTYIFEMYNCIMDVAQISYYSSNGYLSSDFTNGTNDFRLWTASHKTNIDTSKYNSAPSSIRVRQTPSYLGNVSVGSFYVPVSIGQTVTASIAIRKSTSDGDTTSYTGPNPSLIVKANPILGITENLILATATGGNGVWSVISGVTDPVLADGILEFAVQYDSDTSITNQAFWIDDFTATTSSPPDTSSMGVGLKGEPIAFVGGAGGPANNILIHRPRRVM